MAADDWLNLDRIRSDANRGLVDPEMRALIDKAVAAQERIREMPAEEWAAKVIENWRKAGFFD